MNKISSTRSIYVLVHGAWHGGWCWKKVKSLLEAEGHSVYTPTLTGLGERSHLLKHNIDLTTHIKDVVSVLEYEDLYNVVLIGHSYGGMIISGVAEKVPNRLSHLVYLDAFLPDDKKSILDYLKVPGLEEIITDRGDGWKIPFLGKIEDLGVTKKEDIEWVTSRIGYQPFKTFSESINLIKHPTGIVKIFIRLSNFPWFVAAAEKASKQGFNCYQMFSGGHNAMISKPKDTAQIILKTT